MHVNNHESYLQPNAILFAFIQFSTLITFMVLFLVLNQRVKITKNAEIGNKIDELVIFEHVKKVDFMPVSILECCELIDEHYFGSFFQEIGLIDPLDAHEFPVILLFCKEDLRKGTFTYFLSYSKVPDINVHLTLYFTLSIRKHDFEL